MKQHKKRAGFFLKLLVATLVMYAAVQLVVLQIGINAQHVQQARLISERDELRQKTAAEQSFIDAFTGSVGDDEANMDDLARIHAIYEQIARDELGYVLPDELLIVDVGH